MVLTFQLKPITGKSPTAKLSRSVVNIIFFKSLYFLFVLQREFVQL